MEISSNSIDGLLLQLYKELLKCPERNEGGTRGPCTEMIGVTLRLKNPLARVSRSENRGKPFSAIGELLWYLSKSDRLDFIEPYVPKYKVDAVDGKLPGAYGPRLYKMRNVDQIQSVCDLLRRKRTSKRAVIQLFNSEDLAGDSEVPCTTTLQFHQRNQQLRMSVTMRSNDAFLGLPHDVFCFTMLQELIARHLGVELGEYIHHVGSMHVYDTRLEDMRSYTNEGHHKLDPMPCMPVGDPFPVIPDLLRAEDKIRHGEEINADDYILDPYWSDIIRLVQAFWASGKPERLSELKAHVKNPVYLKYLKRRINASVKNPEQRTSEDHEL